MNSHSGFWRLVADGWGDKKYSYAEVLKAINTCALDTRVGNMLVGKLNQACRMLSAIEHPEAGQVSQCEEMNYFIEPINHRLVELRIYSPLLVATYAEVGKERVNRIRYIGTELYVRAETGLIYNAGVTEDRNYDTPVRHGRHTLDVIT